MAEYRKVATKTWADPWVFSLKPEQKLIWLWLITNDHGNAAGIYQIPTPFIAFETGVPQDEVEAALQAFHEAGKIMWDAATATIWVKKMRAYQASASPKLRAAMERDLAQVPDGPVKAAYLAFYEGAADEADEGAEDSGDSGEGTEAEAAGEAYPEGDEGGGSGFTRAGGIQY